MKLLFLIGNGAVGKMTVGQELMKITNLRLFHNHMSIEPVIDIFGYFNATASSKIREVIFEEFSTSDNYGMIFTYMWAFDMKSDWDYIEHVKEIFKRGNKNVEFYYVELVASKEVRMERNITANRLAHKASKRNIEESNERVMNFDSKYRLESYEGEITFPNYLKIDNSKLLPDKVAQMIKDSFKL